MLFQTMWIQAGVGKSVRNIPIHYLFSVHGSALCQILPALHNLTGADYTSKVGSKFKALQEDPKSYLSKFGQGNFLNINK